MRRTRLWVGAGALLLAGAGWMAKADTPAEVDAAAKAKKVAEALAEVRGVKEALYAASNGNTTAPAPPKPPCEPASQG